MQRTTNSRARVPATQRRAQLAELAAQRFYRLGFHGVALADVASAAGLTAPAVYRHFRSKRALLTAAIHSGLDVVDAAFAAAGPELPESLHALAGAALRRRDLWILLQRETRHLDDDDRADVRARFGLVAGGLGERIRADRPSTPDDELPLLVTAVLATLASPSTSRLRTSRGEHGRVLAAAAYAVARVELCEPSLRIPRQQTQCAQAPGTRSEQLLDTAVRMFHERGYAAVSLDDIGAAAGLAGPSIYHHFSTKAELLETAFRRAAQGLSAHRGARTSDLDELVRGYVEAGVGGRQLFGLYVTEAISLRRQARRRIAAELAASVAEWAAALRERRAELTEQQALILVHAARAVVNDVVRVGRLHARPGIAAELIGLVHAVLSADIAGEGREVDG